MVSELILNVAIDCDNFFHVLSALSPSEFKSPCGVVIKANPNELYYDMARSNREGEHDAGPLSEVQCMLIYPYTPIYFRSDFCSRLKLRAASIQTCIDKV